MKPEIKRGLFKGFFTGIGIVLYVFMFYGMFLLATYLLKTSLGIYDIEDSIQKIEKRIENM
jgi:cell division protein FtsL